jgi:hypothetical protein
MLPTKIITNKNPYNFIVNTPPDIHAGLLYNNSLFIDLDQYYYLMGEEPDSKYSPLYDVYNFLSSGTDLATYFENSSYAMFSLENDKIKILSNIPMVFFIVRDLKNPLYQKLKSVYNLLELSVKPNRIVTESLYINRSTCERGHHILSLKKYPPISCPICSFKGHISSIVGFTKLVLNSIKIYGEDPRLGNVALIIPEELNKFAMESKLRYKYIAIEMDRDIAKEIIHRRTYTKAFFAIGLYITEEYDYNIYNILNILKLRPDEKLLYILSYLDINDVLTALPVAFNLFYNFSVMYIDVKQRYIDKIASILHYKVTSNPSVIDDNTIINNVQQATKELKIRIDKALSEGKNIILVYKSSKYIDFSSFTSLYHTLLRMFQYYAERVDFLIPIAIDIPLNVYGFNMYDYIQFIRHVLNSYNITGNFDKLFEDEVKNIARIYPQFYDFIYDRKETIRKMAKIFAVLNNKTVITIDEVKYAIAFFSLMHLLSFMNTVLQAKNLLDYYKSYLGVFYDKYCNIRIQYIISSTKDLENVIKNILSTGPKRINELRQIIQSMIENKQIFVKRETNILLVLDRILNEMVARKEIKLEGDVYRL